ncbi:MAG: MlaD family protein [Candidatus Omnitrophota bacterium]
MINRKNLELEVGIFVVVGIIILSCFLFFISDFRLTDGGYNLKLIFSYANGVKTFAPVRFAGVLVGEVRKINFIMDENKNQFVEVGVWVKSDAKIPVDSDVWVNTLGFLGEKYIEIIPGLSKEYVVQNSQLRGQDTAPMCQLSDLMDRIGKRMDSILTKIDEGKGTVGKFISDDSVYNNFEEFSRDIKDHPWKLLFKPPGWEKQYKK